MSGWHELLLAGIMGFTPMPSLENTNIGGYEDEHYLVDYNRLRAELALTHELHPDFFARVIVDNNTLFTSQPESLHNKTTLYRAYCQYRGMKHFWSVGKQRIPLGVGRIWNPIDVFNPVNIEAIEPGEREGTDSIRYEYAIAELSMFDATLAQDKGAVQVKGFLSIADIGLVGIWDDDTEVNILGWELAGELLDTGIELRSEGGSFWNKEQDDHYTEFIVGAEYGFANSLTLLGEYYFSDNTLQDHLGMQLSYQPAMLWFCYFLLVSNLDDGSGFAAPSIEYSLSDEMTLSVGAFLYTGQDESEYGVVPNRYYVRWFVHF